VARELSLVTGGAGFIGRHLVRHLLDIGQPVRVLDIDDTGKCDPDAELIVGSVTDPAAVGRALQGVADVYHLAGTPQLWAPSARDFEVNVVGTEVLLTAAAARQMPRRIVHCSSALIARMGPAAPDEDPADQPVEVLPEAAVIGAYARAKLAAEKVVRRGIAAGLPVVVVHPTMPIGPGDDNLSPPTEMLLKFLSGRSPAYLDTRFNLVDVRDAAAWHALAADHGRIGAHYVLGGETLAMAEVLAMLEAVSGVAMPRRQSPYWLAFAAGVAFELGALVTRRPPPAALAGVRQARRPMELSSAKAERELGYRHRPVRQAMADAVAWLAGTGRIALPARPPLADAAQ
jgi:dihydroflavonol-4-reductase